MGLTYAESGVDRELRKKSKVHLRTLKSTYSMSKHGKIIETAFNILYPIGNGKYQVKTADGIGTKVLLAELANKHDTIATDGIAMVVNDCIRCGAEPIALTNAIDIKKSEPTLLAEIQKGLAKGAEEANCPLFGGEIADVPELLNTLYHINCDCIGEITKKNIIDGRKISPKNVVIGLRSSGVHSNGISLLRRALFKKWGGRFDAFVTPDGFDRELIFEALEPTAIYVKPFLKIIKDFDILGAVNITGDAYLKFERLTRYGFEFDNFKPQPIFELIQKAGNVEMKEMFSVFNMGWGFALVVKKEDVDDILQKLKNTEVIGRIVQKGIVVRYKNEKIILSD